MITIVFIFNLSEFSIKISKTLTAFAVKVLLFKRSAGVATGMTQSAYALRCQLLPFKCYYSNKDRPICQRKRLKNRVKSAENLSPNFTYSGAICSADMVWNRQSDIKILQKFREYPCFLLQNCRFFDMKKIKCYNITIPFWKIKYFAPRGRRNFCLPRTDFDQNPVIGKSKCGHTFNKKEIICEKKNRTFGSG